MDRITKKAGRNYSAVNLDQAVERLGKLEDMYEALCAELAQTIDQMERLSAEGKGKSATYRQLFANKLTLMNLKARFELYGMQ